MKNMDNTIVLMKKCKKCGEEKPIIEFNKNKKFKCGYRTQCKTCSSLYYKENKERIAVVQRAYNEANKERISEYSKSWREENKEHYRSLMRAWREENIELVNAQIREWKKANPELLRKYEIDRRAKKRNADGDHTVADIRNLLSLQKSKCAVCNTSIAKGYHVDHIVSISKGGSNDKYNLQLLCAPCNLSKNAKDPIEFMQKTGFLL